MNNRRIRYKATIDPLFKETFGAGQTQVRKDPQEGGDTGQTDQEDSISFIRAR